VGLNAVLFDLGGVVLQGEPHRAYQQVLDAEHVDASVNRQHFGHTLTAMVPGTGAVLAELARAGVRLLALTHWSAETLPHAQERFGLLRRFDEILVSGSEQLAKPDPAIFRSAIQHVDLDPTETLFVADSGVLVAGARSLGLTGLAFTEAQTLRHDLVGLGLLAAPEPVTEPIFHIAESQTWATAKTVGRYPWSSRGVSYHAEGFVHCAYADQVPGVLARHYAGVPVDDLVLLELDLGRLAGSVVVEDLGAGPYPHLFAELDPSAVVVERQIVLDPLGWSAQLRAQPGRSPISDGGPEPPVPVGSSGACARPS